MTRRYALGGLLVLLALATPAWAVPVTICERPDGGISEVTILPGGQRDQVLQALQAQGLIGDPAVACWDDNTASLPSNSRPDPREPNDGLSQRHRWRRGPGNTVVIDPTIMEPHAEQFQRAIGKLLSLDRQAAIMASGLGDNFLRSVRGRDWPMAAALLRQMAQRAGTPTEVLTSTEVDAIRVMAKDYEANLD